MADTIFSMEVKAGGVYLTVTKRSVNDTVSEKEIMEKIKEFEIKDADYSVLSEFTSSKKAITSIKISNNTDVKSVDEAANVSVDNEKMSAYIEFKPPINNGRRFVKDDIKKIIQDFKVTHGHLDEVIENISSSRMYDKKYIIAKGQEQVDGIDGYVKYNFDTKKREPKPILRDDGTVDYFNVKLYEETNEGFILAERIPPIKGSDGYDVFGNIIRAKVGKEPGRLPNGKNIHLSEDGNSVIASCGGQIDYKNEKLNINPILTLKTVNNTTGNIEFNGAVVVEGDVVNGYSINATGSIEIRGTVEGSEIISAEDILILSGLRGREKAFIRARGNITVKFVENAKLVAGGSIYSDSIMHSQIEANNELILAGKNGLLVGGYICVGDKIEAAYIGSNMATQTIIELGNTPERLAILYPLQEALLTIRENILKTEQIIEMLKSSKIELSEQKKKLFIKSHHTKIHLINKKIKVEQDLADILPTFNSENGVLIARQLINCGVKVTIGNCYMTVTDPIESCRLNIENEQIVISSCY